MYYRRIRAEIACIPDATIIRNQVSQLLAFLRPPTQAFYLASTERADGHSSPETSNTLHVSL